MAVIPKSPNHVTVNIIMSGVSVATFNEAVFVAVTAEILQVRAMCRVCMCCSCES